MSGTQRELEEVNSQPILNRESQGNRDMESLTKRKRKVPTNSLVAAAM